MIRYTISKRDGSLPREFYASKRVQIAEGVAIFVNANNDGETIIYPLDWISMIHGKDVGTL